MGNFEGPGSKGWPSSPFLSKTGEEELTAWQKPPELREVAVPEPGPGEVLIKVGGAGACHSDLHLMEWPEGDVPVEPAVHPRPRERRAGSRPLGRGVDG